MTYALALIPALAFLAVYLWQDGYERGLDPNGMADARFYCGVVSPPVHPFNRRFRGWHPTALMLANWAGFVFLVTSMGDWRKALLVASLPGMWIMCTFATVDGPAIALAWASALLCKAGHPVLGACVALAGGFVHERSPVFAAIYALSPWPLLGLVAPAMLGALYKSSNGNLGFMFHARGSQRMGDWLDWNTWVWPLRGVVPIAVVSHAASPSAWLALGVSAMSRLMGNDISRFFVWAAMPFVHEMPAPPLWMCIIHVVSFRRYWR